jgi:glutamate-ammonia-ligase adenylyltransferase
MGFVAERYSGYFRRSLFAIGPDSDACAWLRQLVEAPIDAQAIKATLARESAREPAPVALRRMRRLVMMALMERDLRALAPLAEVCATMTRLAEIATATALDAAMDEVAESYGVPLDRAGAPQDLLAVGMGKGGADELNVSSDLDLVFVFREEGVTSGIQPNGQPARRGSLDTSDFFTRVARRASAILSENTADGFVFRVDTRLRPNGDSGPLVVSLSMLEEYFYSQGREWERFAWLKARVIAASSVAGAEARERDDAALTRVVQPFVFRRYIDYDVFAGLRDLHRMIRAEAARRDFRHAGTRDVKLGRGGIREIEFAAQLFEIVRGGRDLDLRDRATLPTLAVLGERNLLPSAEAEGLAKAYGLLRRVEHAIQYREDEQTHRLPADAQVREEVAAMIGLTREQLESELDHACALVERVFNELLAEPESEHAGGAQGSDDLSETLDADTARRFESFREGPRYRAARADARRSIDALFAEAHRRGTGPTGLNRLIDLLETVCRRPAYLALMVQFPHAFERVLQILGQSRWAAEYLIRHPIVLDELLDGNLQAPVDYGAWQSMVNARLDTALIDGAPDVELQMDMVREAHHSQLFRLLAQDLEGSLSVERLADHLSDLADRVIEIAIARVWPQLRLRFCDHPRFAVIGYGRLGGKELGYASDLDLVFLYDDDDERAPQAYAMLAQRVSAWLSTRTAAGQLFETDLRLRPNGNAGLMVSSVRAFEEYQKESAWVWEHQALSRARFCCGDAKVGAEFERIRREILQIERDPATLRDEVLKMRERMHDGHPNRSELFDLKHDRGGMVDIEFAVQYLVLLNARSHPRLLDNVGNIALLGRAAEEGLIAAGSAAEVADAYRRYRRLQHALRLDNSGQYARIEPAEVATEVAAVTRLWDAVFAPAAR